MSRRLRTLDSLLLFLFLLLTPLTTSSKITNPKSPPRNAILLSKVSTLTLRSTRMTTSRRVPAVPQLSCIGPRPICALYTIDVMRCTNEGADYEKEDIQWACRADLPEEFKLGSTDVACEGYESRDDPYVLKGSCGVEYRLVLTEKGEKRFGRVDGGEGDWEGGFDGESPKWVKVLFFVVFGGVLFVIVSGFVRAFRGNSPRLGGDGGGAGQPPWFGGGGGGGGGDDGPDDPPPPYDSHGYGAGPKKSWSTNTRSGSGSSSGSRQQQQQGWRPGPWTAGLAGAGLGYALGRGQNRTQARQNTRQGGFFGNGGGPSSSSPSPPTFSSSRHSSTGFGGTYRR